MTIICVKTVISMGAYSSSIFCKENNINIDFNTVCKLQNT